jgi:hypothetical protein
MINDALRQQAIIEGTFARVVAPDLAMVADLRGAASRASAWTVEPDRLELLLDAAEVDVVVAEAARWAERITLCVTAPHSQHGSSPLWGELLARGTKCDRIMVRRPEQAEGWLLHRLHDTGALLLVEGGGKQVASNVLMFCRSDEQRVVLSHIPLDRALSGAAFGTLLCFRGAPDATIARACQTQAESWASRARFASGSDIDALTLDPRRREPVAVLAPAGLRAVTSAAELGAAVERLQRALEADGAELASLRAFPGGYRLTLEQRDRARPPLVLSLYTDTGWAAGNALLLEAPDGGLVLGWRGGLLGQGRPRAELMWAEARLPSWSLEDAQLGSLRLGLVAHTAQPLGPQLGAFAAEVWRLGRVFGVEPPPALGHVLSDFATLSSRQQVLLLWRALVGLGALGIEAATAVAIDVLRDQGYLRGPRPEPGGALFDAISALLVEASEVGRSFDRPLAGMLRAIQPDASTYEPDDWLECLLCAVPEHGVVARRTALRLGYELARDRRGLAEPSLRTGGGVARALESAVSSALRRGLLARVGATGLTRVTRDTPPDALPQLAGSSHELGAGTLLDGWERALGRLGPLGRATLTRRAGWYGRREDLESIAGRLGLASERARQIEADAWREVASDAGWVQTLRARLERALSGARCVDVGALVVDDAFWRGAERHLELCDALFEALLGAEVRRVELGAGQHRREFFARFTQAELDRVWSELLSEVAALPLPVPLSRCVAACAAASERLDPALLEPFREELERRLVLDSSDPTQVSRVEDEPAGLEAFPGEHAAPASEALLRLEDVLRSIFRTAGTPLGLDAVAERVSKRLDDVSRETLVERSSRAPFVRRNPDQYGLLARDVPGGPEAIAGALNEVTEALVASERALDPDAVLDRVRARVGQTWSPDLVYSLIGSEPALHVSPERRVTLRRWEHARLLDAGDRPCPSVPSSARARFDKLLASPLAPEDVRRRLGDELRRLERAGDLDDFVSIPLARQLVDLHQRLLVEAPLLPGAEPLAAASASFFLDAIAVDEEGEPGDEPAVDRERLLEARAVLQAVCRWLGLSWLDGR